MHTRTHVSFFLSKTSWNVLILACQTLEMVHNFAPWEDGIWIVTNNALLSGVSPVVPKAKHTQNSSSLPQI